MALAYQKNELNKRRRRFYNYWVGNIEPSPYTAQQAEAGYRQAQEDMKKLTPIMKIIMKETNAVICWNSSGGINHVLDKNTGTYHHNKTFKKYYDDEVADKILLGIEYDEFHKV